MYTMRAISIYSAACLAAAVVVGSGTARADDCAAASNSAIAQAKVPHADTHTMTEPGKAPSRMEMIFTADKIYAQEGGSWQSMPYSVQQQIDTITAATAREVQTPHTCQKLASSPIGGEAASLLVMHVETSGKVEDARVWISDKTGLPLKSEVHLANGTVFTDEFRYDNIQAPPGAK